MDFSGLYFVYDSVAYRANVARYKSDLGREFIYCDHSPFENDVMDSASRGT